VSHPDIAQELGARVVRAVKAAVDSDISVDQALVRPSAPGRPWDYQSNAAMGLAKRLGVPSRELAGQIADHLDVEDVSEAPSVEGPGFLNFQLRGDWLEARLAWLRDHEHLGIEPVAEPRRVIVDYSAPNVAKEMHVGHLRSTIIGDALARLERFAGNEVIPQNHLGDWGTPFGMLIEHMLDEGWTEGASEHSIGDLNDFYQAARAKFDSDPSFSERSRSRVVALQGGDPATLELWRGFVEESERHFDDVYARLGVLLAHDHVAGESFYNPLLAPVVEELAEKGLTVEDEGAICVFPPGFKGRTGEPMPLIVQKSDGGYTYDTTDLAAIRYRICDLGARQMLYVVGAPQRLHFEMIFAAARMAGWLDGDVDARHVAFGSVLGEDNKMLRTRAGRPVTLAALLQEAVEHAAALLAERGVPEGADPAALARAIGIGAVKYADLSTDRERDYVFSFDRMLSLDGNTSVYLQYANARALSVLARGGEPPEGAAFALVEPAERDLALKLLQFPATFHDVLIDMRPHKLCSHLFDTAVAYSAFWEQVPILQAPDETLRHSRLALSALTSRVISGGLGLLGIEAPKRL
jgi:arginyl-tRNA synthetase